MPGLADPGTFQDFVDGTGTGAIQHISDETQELWTRFGVSRQRTYVYVNDDGTFQQAGYGNLAADVQALIAN